MDIIESHKFSKKSYMVINYLDTKDKQETRTLDIELIKDKCNNIVYKDYSKCARELSMHLVWYTTYIEIKSIKVTLYLDGESVEYDKDYLSCVLLDTAILEFLQYMKWDSVTKTVKSLSSKLRELDFKILSNAHSNAVVVRFIGLSRDECIEELQNADVTDYIGYRNCLYFQVTYNDKLKEMKHSVLLGTINNM